MLIQGHGCMQSHLVEFLKAADGKPVLQETGNHQLHNWSSEGSAILDGFLTILHLPYTFVMHGIHLRPSLALQVAGAAQCMPEVAVLAT